MKKFIKNIEKNNNPEILWNQCDDSIDVLRTILLKIEELNLQDSQECLNWLDNINEISVTH